MTMGIFATAVAYSAAFVVVACAIASLVAAVVS